LGGARDALLDVANRVVREVAREPAREAQRGAGRRSAEALHVRVDESERIARLLAADHGSIAHHAHHLAADLDRLARRQAHDRIAPEALAADHRFQQVGAGRVGELEIDGERRIEVREGLEVQRNSVEAGAAKRQEFVFSHGSPHGSFERKGRARAR
jgi:hypothetical protein